MPFFDLRGIIMSRSVFPIEQNDYTKEYMFFGTAPNINRNDVMRFPKFNFFTEQQQGFFWRPSEIDCTKDRVDYMNMEKHEQHIFVSNIKYQSLLDSVQGRAPLMVLGQIVSLPELETWLTNWQFSECLIKGTEILTSTGWMDMADIDHTTKVAQYNNNGEVEFVLPINIIKKHHSGTIYKFKSSMNAQYEQHVTPNHRMPYVKRGGSGDSVLNFEYAENYNFKSSHKTPVAGFKINGKTSLTAVERLAIATQADGRISDRYDGSICGTIPIWFSFSKQRKIDRLLRIIKQTGFTFVELSKVLAHGNKKEQRTFKVNVPIEHNPQNWKSFDWVSILELSYNSANEFLDELAEWDSFKHNTAQDSFTFSSTNKKVTDVIQSISSLCGRTARLTKKVDNRSENFNDIYSLLITKRQYKDGQNIIKSSYEYDGMVYCVTVPSGAFICRYNNVVSVSGNCIHEQSYTHILRNVFRDPSQIFDTVLDIPEIVERAKNVTKHYDELYAEICKYNAGIEVDLYQLKTKLFKCVVVVYFLESVRFYGSFVSTFSFAKRGVMEGQGKIMQLIARDEYLHQGSTHYMITRWLAGLDDPVMTQIAHENIQFILDTAFEVCEQEKLWADYLFQYGSILGLNAQIMKKYQMWLTNARVSDLLKPKVQGKQLDFGYVDVYNDVKSNPIPWVNEFLVSDNVQVAPQEAEISSYMIGQINVDVDDDFLGDLEL